MCCTTPQSGELGKRLWGHLGMAMPLIPPTHFKNEVSAWEQEGTKAGE